MLRSDFLIWSECGSLDISSKALKIDTYEQIERFTSINLNETYRGKLKTDWSVKSVILVILI